MKANAEVVLLCSATEAIENFAAKSRGTRVTGVERNTRLNQLDRITRQFALHFVEFATSDLTISYIYSYSLNDKRAAAPTFKSSQKNGEATEDPIW